MFCVQNSVVQIWLWMNLTRCHLWSLKGLTDQAQSQPQSDGFIKCPMTLLVTELLPDGFIRCSMSLHLTEHKHNTNTWQQGNMKRCWKGFCVFFSVRYMGLIPSLQQIVFLNFGQFCSRELFNVPSQEGLYIKYNNIQVYGSF